MRRRPDPGALGGLLLAGLIALGRGDAEEPDLGWLDRAALDAGEVLFDADRDAPRGRVDVRAAVLIDAPPEAVWDVLIACEESPEYVPNIVRCELIETLDSGRAQLFLQTVRSVFLLPRFEQVFRLDYEPHTRIDVTRVSGPLAHMEGRWWLIPEPDGGVLLLHELELDPGMPVPRVFVRNRLRRDLPEALRGVRERAQALVAGP
jgi:ribosome-associated toxin RatA of RatAB toxin-antitoxin module